jgi:protein phosphatase
MKLSIPDLSLVVLIGASGAGKSTFARAHFKPTEVVSSDACRALVADDENDQSATGDAFEVLRLIAAKRLAAGRLTVVDATNVQAAARVPLVAIARQYHCLPVAVVFDLPEEVCQERNRARPDRAFGPHVVRHQRQDLRRSLKTLGREGFRHVFALHSPEEVDAATIAREPLYSNRTWDHGPFDIVGDTHGCYDELEELLQQLGYEVVADTTGASLWDGPVYAHPRGRTAVFVGDLVDRGPRILDTARLVRNMVAAGHALCVPGNHDMKLVRKLRGRDAQLAHGLEDTLAELAALPGDPRDRSEFERELADFLDGLPSHYALDDGRLVVAHAGMKESMQGRGSRAVREFALYGETTGETDEWGLPVRHDWAAEYHGKATVVYGHTPVPRPEWLNNTVNIDTGVVYGGRLTALRYPEREFVSVPARRAYQESKRPFLPGADEGTAGPGHRLTAQQRHDDLLDIDDVLGKRLVETGLQRNVTIREENAAAALEVMSRFAVGPRWLVYLPPTMSPCETSKEPGLLEHPAEAFAYYRAQGIARVICEEKHMGSRAVVVVCKDADVARRRFGVVGEGAGVVYTRTGRRFFEDAAVEEALLGRVRAALGVTSLWEELATDWAVLDCELLPWSAKAQGLVREQYAAVGAAARSALGAAVATLREAVETGSAGAPPAPSVDTGEQRRDDLAALLDRYQGRLALAEDYVAAYGRYCWPVASVDDLKLAPFHLLATEGAAHTDKSHTWHLETLARLCHADEGVLLATPHRLVDVEDEGSVGEGVRWWEELTGRGGEGMVVKPLDYIARGGRGLAQPAVKCRGREYLRIIYGPEYTERANLERLRSRGLGTKRSLALREFALGVESLDRFARGEPLRRVHECVFGVLALESEPVDPRL